MRATSKRVLVMIAIPVLLSPLAACSKSNDTATTNTTAAGSGGASTTAAGGSAAGGGTAVKAAVSPGFDPKTVTAKAGGTIEFTSTDGKPHEPTAGTKDKPEEGVFDVTVPANGKGSTPALKAGTIKYFCALHPSMTGEITVS